MSNRKKTPFRHITPDGSKVRVTQDGEAFYIGDTNERAEGKMVHHKRVNYNNGKLPSKRPDYAINNPFYGSGHGEMDDYAHTADDL